MALQGATGGGCVEGPWTAQEPLPELFILAAPEVKVVVDKKGREFTGPEQPLGVGHGICMEGREGRAP